jgi:tellurite resistance-related uncharacterized protein
MPTLPRAVKPYRRTDTFTPATIPAGLLRSHATKAGVWGLIHVLEGHLIYRVTDPRRAPVEKVLSPDQAPGIIAPGVLHEVEPIDEVRFYVEFHREEATGS